MVLAFLFESWEQVRTETKRACFRRRPSRICRFAGELCHLASVSSSHDRFGLVVHMCVWIDRQGDFDQGGFLHT
jgi:hypothetical protein